MRLILICTIIFINFFTSCQSEKIDKADFILPYDIPQTFILVLGEKCGEKIELINGRKQYYFPKNGFLIIQDDNEKLPLDYKFYQLDKKGKKEEIGINYHRKEDGRPYPGIRILGLSEFKIKDGSLIKEITFKILNTKSDSVYSDIFEENKIDRTLRQLVKACREK